MNKVALLSVLAGFVLGVLAGAGYILNRESTETEANPEPVVTTTAAQPVQEDLPVTIGFRRNLHSEILDETRGLRVFLPDGYDPQQKENYALLVLTDGPWDFRVAASMANSLSYVWAVPQMVVVGIPNRHRDRDLIPMPVASIPGSGGGGEYLESLESEVIPYIDEHWPSNGFRIFSGHSLGGLTALNVFKERPDLFDAYIALSASLEVGEGLLLDQLKDMLSGHQRLDKMLYLAVGDEHQERFYFDQLVEYLDENAPEGLLWAADIFDATDDHNSMRVTGALSGLRWVFQDWMLRSPRVFDMSIAEMEAHYEEASRRYKQQRELGINEITLAAFWGFQDPERIDRSVELARLAVEKWPEDESAYAALAETLAAAGDFEAATAEMEKAISLAQASGSDHLNFYRGSLQRIKAGGSY